MSQNIDLGQVLEEILEESRRRRASPEIAQLEQAVEQSFQRFSAVIRVRDDGHKLRSALRQAERLSAINHLVPTASKRPLGGPIKKSIRNAVAWYMGAVVSQVRDFIRANLNALRVASAAITTLEERVQELESQVKALQGDVDPEEAP
jgi:hypothetical protein